MELYTDAHHLPAVLWLVRHGESAGNVARDEAMRTQARRIALSGRDVDVPLSPLGARQSEALGKWFAKEPQKPEVVIASPYRRACDTATRIVTAGGAVEKFSRIVTDERLREKEFGILDGLTRLGIEHAHPEQANIRTMLGKFYHRPPGGESWCDVILRLRSLFDTLSLHYAGRNVLIVTHQVVVLCMRYLLEGMDEGSVLAIDKAGDIANCGITEYRREPHAERGAVLKLARFNYVVPLQEEGAAVTSAPDEKAAAP